MIVGWKLRNILSWVKGEFDVPQGVIGYEGWNYDDDTPEGSGKSAAFNGLTWILFGQIPKPDVKIDDVMTTGAKTCGGSVLLENGWQIARQRKPNDLFILTDKKKKIKGKDAQETQKMIEELLGMSFETWCQAVYFAQNYPKKFVTSNEADKGKILSEIQELGVFERARIGASVRMKKIELSLTDLRRNLEGKTRLVDQINSSIAQLDGLREQAIEEHKERLSEIEVDIKNNVERLGSIAGKLEDLDEDALVERKAKAEKDYEKFVAKRTELQAKVDKFEEREDQADKIEIAVKRKTTSINKIKVEIADCENPKDKTCSKCGIVLEEVDATHFASHIKSLKEDIKEYRAEIAEKEEELNKLGDQPYDELESQLEDMKRKVKRATYSRNEAEDGLSSVASLTTRLIELDTSIEHTKTKLKKEQARKFTEYDERLAGSKAELKTEETELKKLKEEVAPLETQFNRLVTLRNGFKEVKSYVFQGVLRELTARANHYLESLYTIPVRLEFANEGSEGGISKIGSAFEMDGVTRSLGLASGGQFRRVQLAVDLALSDIVSNRGRNPIKLRIFDESMKDLSEKSMEKMLELLTSLPGSTILIEHNTLFKSIVDHMVKVELNDKVSTRVQ